MKLKIIFSFLFIISFLFYSFQFFSINLFTKSLISNDFYSQFPEPTTKEIEDAEKYLNLPIWSLNYNKCNSEKSEITCKQLLVASSAIQSYEKKVLNNSCKDYVYSKLDNLDLPEKMSIIYHGFQMAMASGRYFVTDINNLPFSLPNFIKSPPENFQSETIKGDYKFGCQSGPYKPNITIIESSWPQVIYTNHVYNPLIKKRFNYHSAYFLGNYLFGLSIQKICDIELQESIIEIWEMPQANREDLKVKDYYNLVNRCGINYQNSHSIIHSKNYDISLNFKSTFYIEDINSKICSLKQMIGTKRLVQTFGSRLGWWAMALSGKPAGAINSVDNVCFNITNSQRGSLWHTYFKFGRNDAYRINSWFYICGMNTEVGHDYSINLI